MTETHRADLRDARCAECGARCIPGQTHLKHNAGWRKKILTWDWHELSFDAYDVGWRALGWDVVPRDSEKHGEGPSFVKLAIKNKVDKSSEDITREFDDVAVGRFYGRDFSRDGSVYVGEGEWYDAGWWFQKREDAVAFVLKYGGTAQ